jgi:hypothetical protein
LVKDSCRCKAALDQGAAGKRAPNTHTLKCKWVFSDPGAAGNREDPHASEVAGECAAAGTGTWPGVAGGLRLLNRDSSGDPTTKAAGAGCARGFSGPMHTARRQEIARRRHHGEAQFGWAIKARQISSRPQPAFKDGFKRVGRCVSAHAAECKVPWGRKRAFAKPTLTLTDTDKSRCDCDVVSVDQYENDGQLEFLEEVSRSRYDLNSFRPHTNGITCW